MRLDSALRTARTDARPIVVPYLMVDRGRARELAKTVEALARGGATALELGFPFSDPIADGPVLEAAAMRSLAHRTSWPDLLSACREASRRLPTAVMTYANPVWRRGLDRGLRELASAGASGLIVPDLSFEESSVWRSAARAHRLSMVLLLAPGVSRRRVQRIAHASRGFVYLVSRYGTTGRGSSSAATDLGPIVRAAHGAVPTLPVLVGFGVRDRATTTEALTSGADGVIVGSALEELIERHPSAASVERWLRTIASVARPSRSTGS